MVCCHLRLIRVSKSMLRRAAMYLSVHSAFFSPTPTSNALGWGTFGGILLAFISRVHPTAGDVSHGVVIRTLPAYCDTIVHIHQVFKRDTTQDREQIRVFGGRQLPASSTRIVPSVRRRHGIRG
ncbi:unnamed protein product, partial [Ixodes pacificus]